MTTMLERLCAAFTLLAGATLCHAVTGGQTDTFANGSTDGYLLLSSSGNLAAGLAALLLITRRSRQRRPS